MENSPFNIEYNEWLFKLAFKDVFETNKSNRGKEK